MTTEHSHRLHKKDNTVRNIFIVWLLSMSTIMVMFMILVFMQPNRCCCNTSYGYNPNKQQSQPKVYSDLEHLFPSSSNNISIEPLPAIKTPLEPDTTYYQDSDMFMYPSISSSNTTPQEVDEPHSIYLMGIGLSSLLLFKFLSNNSKVKV